VQATLVVKVRVTEALKIARLLFPYHDGIFSIYSGGGRLKTAA